MAEEKYWSKSSFGPLDSREQPVVKKKPTRKKKTVKRCHVLVFNSLLPSRDVKIESMVFYNKDDLKKCNSEGRP
jgi:hypothetical protein